MPVYNADKYLDRSIKSVLDQVEQDFELILVNDGSTDNSLAICQKWKSKYPDKIMVVDNENKGSLLTRRDCLHYSSGEYLYVMDADDYLIDKNALRIIRNTIETYHNDLVIFNCVSSKDITKKYFNIPFHDKEQIRGEDLKRLYECLISGYCLNPLWNKVFSRTIVDWGDDYSGLKEITNGTDMYQSIPIVSLAKSATYIDESFYSYTIDDNSRIILHTFKPTIYYSMKRNFLRLIEYSKRWEHKPEKIKELLKRKYMRICSTAAYKIRLIRKEDRLDRVNYLMEIAEDSLFRKYYTINGVPVKRAVIVFMLYHKMYYLLNKLI